MPSLQTRSPLSLFLFTVHAPSITTVEKDRNNIELPHPLLRVILIHIIDFLKETLYFIAFFIICYDVCFTVSCHG